MPKRVPISRYNLAAALKLHHGKRFITKAARSLDVNPNTLSAWIKRGNSIPLHIAKKIREKDHKGALDRQAAFIRAQVEDRLRMRERRIEITMAELDAGMQADDTIDQSEES